jgi:lipopolysaccharide export system permease protein
MGTMVAKQGMQETAPNGDRFLVLLNGMRYEGAPGQLDFKIVEFERYAVRIKAVEAKQRPAPTDSLPTLQLIQNLNSGNISELERRLSFPLAALILSLLAIPLSFVNPRAGRSLNLIMALVIYMLYNNLISVTNTLVGQGKLGPVIGFWGIHVLMLMLMVLLFYRRLLVFSVRRWAR